MKAAVDYISKEDAAMTREERRAKYAWIDTPRKHSHVYLGTVADHVRNYVAPAPVTPPTAEELEASDAAYNTFMASLTR